MKGTNKIIIILNQNLFAGDEQGDLMRLRFENKTTAIFKARKLRQNRGDDSNTILFVRTVSRF